MNIGAVSDVFAMSVRENIEKCKELGVTGVQILVGPKTEINPFLDRAARKDFRAFLRSLKLDLAAIFTCYSGHGLETASENPGKIAFTNQVIDLAADLGCPVVASHFGIIPDNPQVTTYQTLRDACHQIGAHAVAKEIKYCIETGPETAQVLKGFLDAVDSRGIGVNLDPANLAMVVRDDPTQAVHLLQGHIAHTHAKDGIQLQPATAMDIYRPSEEAQAKGPLYQVTPFGKGWVNWDTYLKALKDTGFTGYLTIEAEGNPPEEYVRNSVAFLKKKLESLE